MLVAWHSNRFWDWCVLEDEKKEIDPIFIEKLLKYLSVVYNWSILPLELLNYFESKIYKDFELYKVFFIAFYTKLILNILNEKIKLFSIPSDQNMSQGTKFFNTLTLHTTSRFNVREAAFSGTRFSKKMV